MASDSQPTKASPGMTRAELKEIERQRRARYAREVDGGNGRPAVDQLSHTGDDPLLAALKEGKR